MDALAFWLPRIGAAISVAAGLVGFFRPRLFLDRMDIVLQSPQAYSEARAVFGGLNLGMGAAALALGAPAVFTALGVAWATLVLARLWSLAVDGIGLGASLPGLVFDGVMALLFLSPLLLG